MSGPFEHLADLMSVVQADQSASIGRRQIQDLLPIAISR